MKFISLYLDIYTGMPGEDEDKYLAPTNGRTSNYVISPEIKGKILGIWHSFDSDFGNLSAFSIIDVIPYQYAKEIKIFESPEAEEAYPDEIDSLFILRISGHPEAKDGVKLQIKISILYE